MRKPPLLLFCSLLAFRARAEAPGNGESYRLYSGEVHFSPYSQIPTNDRAEALVGHALLDDIEGMERLRSANIGSIPWSDSYWPMAKGGIGIRYADRSFPNSSDWRTNNAYIASRPAEALVRSGATNQLSPAEKYDLARGDSAWTMTRAVWGVGAAFQRAHGSVPSWMGICHGWAAAALEVREPRHGVTIQSRGGISIHFYPSDIKALIAQLWSSGRFRSTLIGSRCDRSLNLLASCFDNNAGTFHLALVNSIGVDRRGFVFNLNSDGQVWNQPAFAYQYSFFNPATRQPTDLSHARVARGSFSDANAGRRSPQTRSIVGVSMTVHYTTEQSPSQSENSSAPSEKTVTVLYDLELDASGRIVGGEWYQAQHPSFLWRPERGARVSASGANYPENELLERLIQSSQ